MKCKYICVRESYDYIKIGSEDNELSQKELQILVNYLSTNHNVSEIIEFNLSKIRFINYVGVIVLEDVILEILPKISLSNDLNKDRELLINMLTICNKLPISINESSNMLINKSSFLEILAKLYMDNLMTQLQKGIYCDYIFKEENLNTLKGKLFLKSHIVNNYANKSRVYCRYDNYSEDNFLNKVLKSACTILVSKVNNESISNEIKKTLGRFNAVKDCVINKENLEKFRFNRNNERYKKSYDFAKLIISNASSKNTYGSKDGFSIIYEMNILYEEYIGKLVSKIWNGKSRRVKLQDKGKYLLINTISGRKNIALRPDIVLYENNIPYIIIDTKWKSITYNERLNYKQGDIYQMYAYVNSYKESKKCILLYPKIDNDIEYPIWRLDNDDKFIEIMDIRLDSLQNTISDLESKLI